MGFKVNNSLFKLLITDFTSQKKLYNSTRFLLDIKQFFKIRNPDKRVTESSKFTQRYAFLSHNNHSLNILKTYYFSNPNENKVWLSSAILCKYCILK